MKYGMLCAGILLMSSSVFANTGMQALSEQVARMEKDLILLQQKVYRGQTTANADLTPDGASDLWEKVMAQETALSELTQKVENLSYLIQQNAEKMSKMNDDIQMQIKMSGMNKVSEEQVKLQETTSKDRKQKAEASDKKNPKDSYDAAYQLLRAGDHVAAEKAFIAFIKEFPQDNLAGNANYWLGETYYARGQFELAAPVFADGFTTYKTNTKAPDNLLKLGMTMNKLGKKEEACTAFLSIKDTFPKADKSLLERAKQEAEKLSCPK